MCTPQNIHIPRSEVSLSSVFCCNAFSLHYYASESENRIACYPICPMGRKLLYYSPPTSFCSVLFGERKNKISMTKIEFPFRYTCFSFSSASQTHFYFSHFKTQKTMLLTTIKCFENGQKCLICSKLDSLKMVRCRLENHVFDFDNFLRFSFRQNVSKI